MKCVICDQEIVGYGNNAEPIDSGKCCDKCNKEKVLPARLYQVYGWRRTNYNGIENS